MEKAPDSLPSSSVVQRHSGILPREMRRQSAVILNALQDQYPFVNAGVPSWISSQEPVRLALELVAYKPAVVIAYDGFNDAATGADYARRGIKTPPGAPESFDELSSLVDDIRGYVAARHETLFIAGCFRG